MTSIIDKGRKRVIIEGVAPEINAGRFPIKRVIGEKVVVTADIFSDGHDSLTAMLLYKMSGNTEWKEVRMAFLQNDRWRAEFVVKELGIYYYTLESWVDHFKTWQKDIKKKFDAGQNISTDILAGLEYIEEASKRALAKDKKSLIDFSTILKKEANTEKAILLALSEELIEIMDRYQDRRFSTRYEKELVLIVDSNKALFSTWYECFPRSVPSKSGRHGTFKDCEKILPDLEKMGFDILYLPPIHPIGKTNRKGKNNSPSFLPDDVGSPWAIGSDQGGHKAVHQKLGTIKDFERLIKKAKGCGIDIAIDLAFQCSPDHPYVKEHPEWFKWRPDGTIQYAENPPKKYEDIFPLNFETEDWQKLWEELKSIVLFWINKEIKIFRVDNPHTKAFPFWEWLIKEIKKDHPEVIFLSEAFTRPKVMYYLAKIGFTQSYTYFTWRNTKWELTEYMKELTQSDVREYLRPNFWPNTPDILPEYLQYGNRPAFLIKLMLAATLSSNYGIYGPAFELCVNEPLTGKEEYQDSEKFEVKYWDWDKSGNLKDFISRINRIRKENTALQSPWNLRFYDVDNDNLLFFGKATEDFSNILLVVINIDPFHTHSGWVSIPVMELGIAPNQPYLVHDLLSDDKFIWQGERNYVELNPHILPGHIFKVRKKLKKETDFDYFM